MNILARLLAPLNFSVREERRENLSVHEANRAASAQLLRQERAYWEGRMSKAATDGEREWIMDELDRLRAMERAS